MDIKSLLEEANYTPKRKASTHGGEYSSPCPFCKDGDDRFLTWPNRHNKNGEYQGGRFSCRVCGKYGDAITFLIDYNGLDYKGACQQLRIEPKKQRNVLTVRKHLVSLPLAENPPEIWLSKAKAFVQWCHTQLINDSVALKIAFDRGLSLDSIIKFKIGFNPSDLYRSREDWGLSKELKEDGTPKKLILPKGLVLPTFSDEAVIKIKVRRSDWKEGDKFPKYIEISGSKKCPSLYGDRNLQIALVLESEIDAMLIQQEAANLLFCLALGGSTRAIDKETDRLIKKDKLLLFCPDFDKAGAVAWKKWESLYPGIRKVLTPNEKSPGDALKTGLNLRKWLEKNIEKLFEKQRF